MLGAIQAYASIGEDEANSRGSAVTAPAVVNSKIGAAWVALTTSAPLDIAELWLSISPGTTHAGYLVDIAVGAAGSEQVIIPNLLVNTRSMCVTEYRFPIAIPAGTRISARCQSTTISAVCYVKAIIGAAAGYISSCSKVIAIGADESDTGGFSGDPGATANTYSAWQTIATPTERLVGIVIAVTLRGNAATSTATWLLEIGVETSTTYIPKLAFGNDTINDFAVPATYSPFPVDIPANTAILVRSKCSISDASDRLFDIALYGMVG